jgi:glycerophosphoryl diester phosphodiesterase
MLNTFIESAIAPNRVWAQSFNPPDIFQRVKEYPEFAKQAVYLDEDGDTAPTLINATARLPPHHHRRQQNHYSKCVRN